jgi:hypothetical protein
MAIATTAPLPRPGQFQALLRSATGGDAALAAPWCGPGDTPLLFSRAAWGLRALADAVAAGRGRPARIWLPDYFCNDATAPLRTAGHALVFYPVAEDLRPDWTACEAMDDAPDMFVLVHYFGWPAEAIPARAFCDARGALLVEDAAHMLAPGPGIGAMGDATLWSLYKHLPVPDGGLLTLRRDGAVGTAAVTRAAAILGTVAPVAGGWIARRAMQTLLPILAGRLRSTPLPFDRDPAPGPLPLTPAISGMARRMLAALGGNIATIATQRRANEAAVRGALAHADGLRPLLAPQAGFVPYRAVFRGDDERAARRWYDRLAARNAVESWPDLPPEVRAVPDRHRAALALRNSIIALPVHADRTPEALAAAYGGAL